MRFATSAHSPRRARGLRRRAARREILAARGARRPTARPRRGSVRPISSATMSRWISGLALGGIGEALGRDLAELAADHDQRVGGRDQVVGDAVDSGRTGRPRADRCRRSRPCRSWCGRPGCRALRRTRAARSAGLRDVDAAADQEQRPLGLRSSAAARSTVVRVRAGAARRRLEGAGSTQKSAASKA